WRRAVLPPRVGGFAAGACSTAAEAAAQRGQALVPRSPDRDHPLDGIFERPRRHFVPRLAPGPPGPEQPGVGQGGELLPDRRAGHRQLGRELCRSGRAARRHRLDQRTATGVTECGEDAVYAAAAAVHASACSSSAGPNSGEGSTTRTRVPATTGSSSSTTLP